jgi:hypothetical protein
VPVKRFVIPLVELVALLALSYGLFLLCADLYTRHNNFPVNWHPDEGGKVSQLLNDHRNFNHPQLMLEAAIWLAEREHTPDRTQAVVEIGRRASAYMAAAGAVMLAWAGYFGVGRVGFLLAAAGAGLCPALLCHAHYFKEDASLCFGVAAVICVGAAMTWRWHWIIMLLLATLLGVACGVAASGKYVGAIMLLPAVIFVVLIGLKRWWILPLLPVLVILGSVQTWQAINHRALDNWQDFEHGFEREKEHGIGGHDNVMIPRPNLYFTRLVWEEAMPHVKVLAIAAPVSLVAAALLARRRRRPVAVLPDDGTHARGLDSAPPNEPMPAESAPRPPMWRRIFLQPIVVPRQSPMFVVWLALCLVAYAAMLSQGTIPFYRYALPLTLMLYATAAIGAMWVGKALQTRFTPAWAIGLAVLAVIVPLQWQRCQDYLNQFAHDCRVPLRDWANTLPVGTTIVCDSYTELDSGWGGRFRTQLNVYRYRFAAETGSVEELVRRRVNYVVIAGSSFERYLDPATTWVEDPASFKERRRFYETLFAKYPIEKSWVANHKMRAFSNPDIYVFKLNDPEGTTRRRRPR